ncbi:hypothetical protein KPL37_02490 [Clostridium frigoris]|uniref:Uncharacterized protein n=1 Tax=Clostridium frigoris TaxID=205327 RepID=A0ABS6BP01_9CLOT|nr:hypothetical protein [Clostridium frigoris]MBU3158642.1 hypothetical protein [Clostridium frigoris]
MHDFRVIGDVREKTLIYDVVVDRCYYSEEYNNIILKQIEEGLKNISPQHRCIVTIDQEFFEVEINWEMFIDINKE